MTLGLLVRQTLREGRGGLGRLVFSIACLAIGVAAVVAIAALSNSFESGIQSNAKEMLGADLALRSNQKLPEGWEVPLAGVPGAQWMIAREQPQVIQAGEGAQVRSLLAEMMVVPAEYPYYGDLELSPAASLPAIFGAGEVVIAADTATRLGVQPGGTLRIAGKPLRVAAIVNNEPDRITGFLYIGPRVYLSPDTFAQLGLADVTVGVRYKALVQLPAMADEEIEAVKADIENAIANSTTGSARVETYSEGRPSLQRGLDRLGRFLGMIALLSLLLGGVGVAQAVRAWIAGRMDAIAVLKCIGMRPREIFVLYVAQAMLLGLIGSAVGAVLGLGFTALLPIAFREYIPADLIDWRQPRAALSGLALGIAVATVFSLPPLVSVLRVPPVRVFRRNAEPLPGARWVRIATALITGLGIAALAGIQARSAIIGFIFTGGVLVTALLLAGGAWLVMKIAARIPRDWGRRVWLRHGLAAIARPGANTIPSVVSLGLGLLVLFSAGIVQNFLHQQLTGTLPEQIPSAVALNIRPDQADGLRAIFEEEQATAIDILPVVMTRLVAVNGAPLGDDSIDESEAGVRRARRAREGRSERAVTYAADLPVANEIVEGEWWSLPDVPEASLDRGWAERRELGLGAKLTFALADGRSVEFEVTNLREDLRELSIPLEVIVEPGYFDDAPQFRIATLRLPPGRGNAVQDRVTAAYPNVTFIPLSDVVERIAAQLNRIGWGVRMLGLFIVGAAVAVLAGTIGIESNRRGREVALLKTVGMTRREVAGVFAAEYALLGLIAGIIGVTGGGVVAWLMVSRALETEFHWPYGLFALAIVAGMIVSVAAGITASIGALRKRPIEMLRHQE